MTFECSSDAATTYVAITAITVGTANPASAITADGLYRVNVAACTQIRLRVSTTGAGNVTVSVIATANPSFDALTLPLPTGANTIGNVNIANPAATSDPCENPNVLKSSSLVNISTATTTQLVALSGTTRVYACGFSATVSGTSPTLLFLYGTGAACATGPVNLSGTFAITTGTLVSLGYGGMLFASAAGNALCLTTGGTTPSVQGVLTYVQQ